MEKKELISQLILFGLKKQHAESYIALLKLGTASPSAIAKEAHIERTTMYKILEELSEKGLINKSLQGKRLHYTAASPAALKETLRQHESILTHIFPTLLSLHSENKSTPTIQVYTSKEAIKRVIMDSLRSKEKVCRDFASVKQVIDLFGIPFVERYINQRIKFNVSVKSLRNRPKQKKEKEIWYLRPDNTEVLREVRYLKDTIDFDSFIKIYDSTIVMISSSKKPFAVVLESTDLSTAMKILFDIAWDTSIKAKS